MPKYRPEGGRSRNGIEWDRLIMLELGGKREQEIKRNGLT